MNHDGRLWTDKDRDGTVDNAPSDVDQQRRRPDPGLHPLRGRTRRVRALHLHQPVTNAYTNMIRSPAQRMKSGLFFGFYHNRSPRDPADDFHVEVEFYKNKDWNWVRTPHGLGFVHGTIHVPKSTPYGLYDGAIVVSGHGQKSIVPVAVNVAATAPQDAPVSSPSR